MPAGPGQGRLSTETSLLGDHALALSPLGCDCWLRPHLSSLPRSFVFLQLYHSPFFGDESNKPILLPNEVGRSSLPYRAPWSPAAGAQWAEPPAGQWGLEAHERRGLSQTGTGL